MPQFCVNAVVATVLKDYIKVPDYEAVLDEVLQHDYANLKLPGHAIHHWYAILHKTSDSVIVQDVLLNAGDTRFATHVVHIADWDGVFMEWIDADHARYHDCHYEFQRGMRSYGYSQ